MSNGATFRHVIFFVIALWLVEKQPVVRGLHARYGECAYSSKTQSGGIKPEVYWINLNTSHSRRKAMTKVALNPSSYPAHVPSHPLSTPTFSLNIFFSSSTTLAYRISG
jgi:hypothetical protein